MKLSFGKMETTAVVNEYGLIIHRPRNDGEQEFNREELKEIIKAMNIYEDAIILAELLSGEDIPTATQKVAERILNTARK